IKTGGAITLEKKPTLDIWAEVKDSKAEKIAEILPPCITKELKTIEKIKHYGVFGDIEASVKAQGAIPQPDITGYVKGENVKILDKKFHKYHTGSVNIKFDKRILNMDILINMLNNQKAFIKGYVYMFRDGINNVTINTTDNINFAIAQKLVVPISKVFNFQLGPIPDMDIKNGYGVINVNVKGSPDYLSINGYSKFDNADLTYKGLYGEIQNGKGALEFNEDVISFESERAFVKNNPLKVKGSVKINDNLNFDISSDSAAAENLLEIINNSDLLKDVKAGLVVINKAAGLTKLFVNIKAKIVPVPFGQPPLPPEEAFYDMKVKGSLELLEDSCYLEGFYTPLENVKGKVDFTEETVVLNNLNAISGTSNLDISGKIITDLKTKIPDVDIEVKSKEVNLKDTIKFLTQSYLYPSNYPDLSCLYEIPLKHDLYFKYKAKAIDFITDKAYAKMNFIEDNNNNPIKAQSGTVILDKSTVTIENAAAYIYDSIIKVKGNVQKVDTLNPIYNLDIISENFNLENLNNPEEIEILPQQAVNIVKEFKDFKGLADINLQLKKNIFSGKIKLTKPQIRHAQTNLPVFFDDFDINLDNNKISIDNFTALIEDMPVYGNIKVSDIYSKMPDIDGYFTSKITNSIIKNYMPSKFAEKLELYGDVNFSVKLKGNEENLKIYPKLTLYPDSDIEYEKINLGDVNNKREFSGDINFYENKVKINKFDYTKYISSQNNAVFPIIFAKMQGEFNIIDNNTIEPIEISLKTNKNISARILNLLVKNHIFAQGALNCDLKYKFDKLTKAAKLIGNIECRNIDIPLLDSVIKNIRIEAKEDNIDLKVFGFISDSRINVHSLLENNLSKIPEIYLLELFADKLDKDNLIKNAAYIHKKTEGNNESK
ncbi:MAG: hypothetical protein LUG16_07075, partial [Candidatus Gastranaerophilales bacterium]|nr:hypothetical protein [Candidatus Gastranaerophilales bacterium]